jgi:SAM-dependent methyltransferase
MSRSSPFYAGLFLTALSTLVLEVVETRILSVVTWYHLAFLAISLALLGMTAGALYVYLRPERFAGAPAAAAGRFAAWFAVSIPASHLALLVLRLPVEITANAMDLLALVLASALLAAPFFFSGVAVAIALTRVPLPIGRLYAADLLGAGTGCLGAILLLDSWDPSTGLFLLGALAALAAVAFASAAGGRKRAGVALAALLLALGILNGSFYPHLAWIDTMKGDRITEPLLYDLWNSHSRITARPPTFAQPTFWGRTRAPRMRVQQIPLLIDGGAFTVSTHFGADADDLRWIRYDLTSLGYHLRGKGGEVAVIGVGGGRDLLAALAFGSRRVTGIEVNDLFLRLLTRDLRDFDGLAGRPDVRLVHAEGRAHLGSAGETYDMIQMALVDTWASTSAGAMTLTENGLYTVEAWKLFLSRLRPGGLLAVSRWYSPGDPGETARLLSLATATLLSRGVTDPTRHLALATSGHLAAILVARDPLSAADVAQLHGVAERCGFDFLVLPDTVPAHPLLARIAAARTPAELAAATRHDVLMLSPPTDDEPFFFNMLRPAVWWRGGFSRSGAGGVIDGNLRATDSLLAILLAVAFLTVATLVVPLLLRGRGHGLAPREFAASSAYFSLIGVGFMLVEIGLMQRFSVLLGHPVYSLAVTLMTVIVSTGLGSLASDALESRSRAVLAAVPFALALVLAALPFAIAATVPRAAATSLPTKILLIVALTAPVGLLLGLCFPFGMRLLRSRSPAAMSWMWGLNGAFGVLGSVLAILVSMSYGISRCFFLAALCYLALIVPIAVLRTAAADVSETADTADGTAADASLARDPLRGTLTR